MPDTDRNTQTDSRQTGLLLVPAELWIAPVPSSGRYRLNRFYKRNGHKGKAAEDDQAFWLLWQEEVLAGVRFSAFADGCVLRGLWVHRSWRGCGLGSQLLQGCRSYWQSQRCYCFPFSHLEAFYRQHGFVLPDSHTPVECLQQLQRYCQRGEDVLLMQSAPDGE